MPVRCRRCWARRPARRTRRVAPAVAASEAVAAVAPCNRSPRNSAGTVTAAASTRLGITGPTPPRHGPGPAGVSPAFTGKFK